MTEPFTFSEGIQLTGLLITGMTALLTVWWRIELRIREVENQHQTKLQALMREHQEFKLHVAENYANWSTVKEIEQRLADRIDSLTEQVIKMPDVVVERMMKYMALKS